MPIKLAQIAICLLGKRPAGDGWLEVGRSSLLESAQEATLMSVPTRGLPRQSNGLAIADFNRKFT